MQLSPSIRNHPLMTVVTRAAVPAERRLGTLSTLQILTGIIVALVLMPLVYLVIRAVGAGESGLAYVLDARTINVLGNSIALMGAVALASALIGVPFAWLTARTDLPLRRFWLVGGLLPMVIPSYVGAMMFIAAFGPRGLLQNLLAPLGVEQLPSIYGFFGAWVAITLFSFPYVVLPVRAALMNVDPALEEAARGLGLNRWRVFLRITLPQLRPAIAAGLLLTSLYTLSDFGAVSLMRYDAFTRVIYLQYTSSFDRSRAAILALLLVLLTLVLLVIERRASRTRTNYRVGVGAQRRLQTVSLGRWRIPALVFCALLVLVGVVVPAGVLAQWVATGRGAWTPELLQPTMNSLGVSGLAAVVVGLLALPPALLAVREPSRRNGWMVQGIYIGHVLPGLVVALALVYFAANYLPSFYQTIPVLVLGYATRFLSVSVGATRSALTQVNPRFEEVARSLGVKPWDVMRRVTVPLIRPGVLAGMALVFLNTMKELPTTLLLAPTGFDSLPADIWTAHTQAHLSQLGVPSLLLIAGSALALVIMLRQEQVR